MLSNFKFISLGCRLFMDPEHFLIASSNEFCLGKTSILHKLIDLGSAISYEQN